MKMKIFSAVLTAMVLHAGEAEAQIYETNNEVVSTFAGFGIPGYVDGQGQLTAFSSPSQIVSDTASNLYVWDSGNARIRKLTPDGTVTTFAGGGSYFDGYGTNVSLAWGSAGTLAMDHANTLWLVLVSGYSGQPYLVTISTNGYVAIANGGLTNLGTGSGLCFDSANNLYYSGGNRIYRYHPGSGIAQAIAGNGINGNFDGQGTLFTAFNNPAALACDQADNLYVWDSGNGTIRRVDQSQNVTTIAGYANSYYSADGGKRRRARGIRPGCPIREWAWRGHQCRLWWHRCHVCGQPGQPLFGIQHLYPPDERADQCGDTGGKFFPILRQLCKWSRQSRAI